MKAYITDDYDYVHLWSKKCDDALCTATLHAKLIERGNIKELTQPFFCFFTVNIK
jgi:hypothetical protein